jgi:hypothetical protein
MGSTTPFIWKEALEAFQLLLSVVSSSPFSCGEGLFKWASSRFIFGAGFFQRKCHLFFSSSALSWESPSLLLRRKRSPFPDAEVSAPLARGP